MSDKNYWGELVFLLDCSGVASDVEAGYGEFDDVDAVMVSRVKELIAERDAALAEVADLLHIIKTAGEYIDDHTRPDVTGERYVITRRIHSALTRNVRNDP